MSSPESRSSRNFMTTKTVRVLTEAVGLLRAPQRIIPLFSKLASDELRTTFEHRHLYSYVASTIPTANALRSVVDWIFRAQRPDGGIAAYYSYLTGYSESYPEVTGYIIPTLYDFGRVTGDLSARHAAYLATDWLLSLQMTSGAFPGGLHASDGGPDNNARPSVFNTGQILQGLVRAHTEMQAKTRNAKILKSAVAAGDWLAAIQQADGSWTGPAAYQGTAHTYYSMVSWALAQLAAESGDARHAAAADRNIDWVLAHVQPSGWIDGINLHGHPAYLHFIAYVIQGTLECGILRRRDDAIQTAAKPAWVLLRKFETHKRATICVSHRECADVLHLAASVRGDGRSALSQRGPQNERDAEAVAPGQGPPRSGGGCRWIVSHLGSVSTDAAHQLGMQVPGRRAHAGAAPYGRVRGPVRGRF